MYQLTEAQAALLKRIKDTLNEEGDHNYREGELDHIPETWTEELTLNLVMVRYCLDHLPDALDEWKKGKRHVGDPE